MRAWFTRSRVCLRSSARAAEDVVALGGKSSEVSKGLKEQIGETQSAIGISFKCSVRPMAQVQHGRDCL
jgi:hypothetical protein